MQVTAKKAFLCGKIQANPSKSMAHRALICALLSRSNTKIVNLPVCDDVSATFAAVQTLGLKKIGENEFCPPADIAARGKIFCGNCGATLRFMLCVLSGLDGDYTLTGSESLMSRPLGELEAELNRNGAVIERDENTIRVRGKIRSGTYVLPGNISSQYVSGLLIALSVIDGNSEIVLTTPMSSSAYVDMTVETLKAFGAKAEKTNSGFLINGGVLHSPKVFEIEGDWSNSAFWMIGAALNGNIAVSGLNAQTTQGDRQILDVMAKANVNFKMSGDTVFVEKSDTTCIEIDADQIIDLVPAIAVLCSFSSGVSKIKNVVRLKYKESNRILSIINAINALCGDARYDGGEIIIKGKSLRGGEVDCCGDHRIAMMAFSAALGCTESVIVNGAETLNKSYPDFLRQYARLGGKIDVGMDR